VQVENLRHSRLQICATSSGAHGVRALPGVSQKWTPERRICKGEKEE
jgi:hypothetical protein